MHLKEAAYIIGSMGGRPLKNPFLYPEYRRGGGVDLGPPPIHGASLLLENGFYLLLEDGVSTLLLEP